MKWRDGNSGFPDGGSNSKTGFSKQWRMLWEEANTFFASLRTKFNIASEYLSQGIHFHAVRKGGCLAYATPSCSPSSQYKKGEDTALRKTDSFIVTPQMGGCHVLWKGKRKRRNCRFGQPSEVGELVAGSWILNNIWVTDTQDATRGLWAVVRMNRHFWMKKTKFHVHGK